MPAKHRRPESQGPSWGLIASIAALLLVLAGIGAAAFLLWNKFFVPSKPAVSPTPAPTAPPATPTPDPTPQPTPDPTPTPSPAPIPDNGQDGYLLEGIYIWNSMAFELFYGYDESAQPYAQAIESFAASLPGIDVYNIVVPNHSEFGLPKRLRDSMGCGSQRENTASIYNSYSAVHPVDIYDIMDQHKEEYLYFNTDTHWTALGAYYAYVKFCEIAGLEASPLESFTRATPNDSFYGYLYEMTYEESLGPDHIDTYEPGYAYTAASSYDGVDFTPLEGINSGDSSMGYTMFLYGDQPCVRVQNQDCHNGRKLVMVKESYGNAIGAFLGAGFEELYVVDFRYFEGNLPQFCQSWGITDLLFLNSTMAANTYQRVEDLYTLFE